MDKNNKQELLNCPFCGGKAEAKNNMRQHWVKCTYCTLEWGLTNRDSSNIDLVKDKQFIKIAQESAAKTWNTRAKPLPDVGSPKTRKINYVVLPRKCPKCGDNLIHNNRGIECGGLKCEYSEGGEAFEGAIISTLPAPLPNNKEVGELVEKKHPTEYLDHEYYLEIIKPVLRQIMLDMGCVDYADIAWRYAAGVITTTFMKSISNVTEKLGALAIALTSQPPATGDDVVEKYREFYLAATSERCYPIAAHLHSCPAWRDGRKRGACICGATDRNERVDKAKAAIAAMEEKYHGKS